MIKHSSQYRPSPTGPLFFVFALDHDYRNLANSTCFGILQAKPWLRHSSYRSPIIPDPVFLEHFTDPQAQIPCVQEPVYFSQEVEKDFLQLPEPKLSLDPGG